MARSPDNPAGGAAALAADGAVVDGAVVDDAVPSPTFHVRVGGFDGPFDLLLSLIAKHTLDITDVSLSIVTDEFLSFIGTLDDAADLDTASAFLVVGATLLDLKLASLLPQGELVDAEDAALLEARDLLFARLLQYRAFKEASRWFESTIAEEARQHPIASRGDQVGIGELPPLDWTVTLAEFAALAERALAPRILPVVALGHLHSAPVSLREQAASIAAILRRRGGSVSFTDLLGGDTTAEIVVARFLAVLELYRHGAVSLVQAEPLGALLVRWSTEDWSEHMLDALGRDWDD